MRPTRQIIRRTFTPGVSLEFLASPNEMSFYAKINSVQVRDNSKDLSLSPISPRKILNLQRSLWSDILTKFADVISSGSVITAEISVHSLFAA